MSLNRRSSLCVDWQAEPDPQRVFVKKKKTKKKARGDLSPRRAQQPWLVLTPLCCSARERKKTLSEEEEGRRREWKGRGETEPSSNRWEAHGRRSEMQTKPKEHEIPLTRGVPSLPRQIYPGSNSPSGRRPPSPALFPS